MTRITKDGRKVDGPYTGNLWEIFIQEYPGSTFYKKLTVARTQTEADQLVQKYAEEL